MITLITLITLGTDSEAIQKRYQDMFGENSDWQAALAKANQPKQPDYSFATDNPLRENKDAFARGVALLEQGELKEAILAFEAAVQQEPDHAEAWRYLGNPDNSNNYS